VIDAAAFFVYEIRDRRIVRDRAFRSRDEALEAVGRSEQAMSDESLEIMRRSIDAFNWGDLEGVLETTPGVRGAPLGSVRSASSLMVSHPGWLGEPDHTRQRQ
jgi:hypothetical protein